MEPQRKWADIVLSHPFRPAEMLDLAWKFQAPAILLTEKHLAESRMSVNIEADDAPWAEGKANEGRDLYVGFPDDALLHYWNCDPGEYRRFAAVLHRTQAERQIKSVIVTSPWTGAGESLTAQSQM